MNETTKENLKNINKIVSNVNYERIVKNYFSNKKGLISILEASKFFSLPKNQKKSEKDILCLKNKKNLIPRKLNLNKNFDIMILKEENDLKLNNKKNQKFNSCQRLSAKDKLRNIKDIKNTTVNLNYDINNNKNDEKMKNIEYIDKIIYQNNRMIMNNLKRFYKNNILNEDKEKEKENDIKLNTQNIKHKSNEFHNILPLIYKSEKDSKNNCKEKGNNEENKELKEIDKNINYNIKNRIRNISISREGGLITIKSKNKTKNLNNTAINKFEFIKKDLINMNMKTLTPLLITPSKEDYTFNFYVNKTYRKQIPLYMKHRINWRFVKNKEEGYSLRWKYYPGRVNYKAYQYNPNMPIDKIKMISVFERYRNVGNKESFFINFIKYCSKNEINPFDYIPFTIILNKSFMYEKSLKNLEDINNIIDKKYNSLNSEKISYTKLFPLYKFAGYSNKDFEDIYIYIHNSFTSNYNYWIVKPPDLFQGMGIKVFKNFKEINEHCQSLFKGIEKVTAEQEEYCKKHNIKLKPKIHKSEYILIQKYLDNPLLYYGRKFDIRCYVLVDYCFNVFICREGHLKACSQQYDLNNLDVFKHITNYSLQKRCKDFAKYEQGNEISFKKFIELLNNENEGKGQKIFSKIFNRMKEEIQLSMNSVGRKLMGVPKVLSFQIFGYDFIIDKKYNPWILEINDNPGLEISSELISHLIPRMIDDAIRLTVDKVFPTKYDKEVISEDGHYKSKFYLEGFNNEENVFDFICNIDHSFLSRETYIKPKSDK